MPQVARPVPLSMVRLLVVHVVLASTTIKQIKTVAKNVVLASTTIKPARRLNLVLVKIAMQENIKTKWEKHRATTIVLVPW
jgi:tRNA U38,U39,U40 pseudouridine synthase TruA